MKAVLFDLDGTIINSEEGITKCVRYALKRFGIEETDLQRLKCFIGPPLEPMFQEKYGFTYAEALKAVEKYRERFDEKGVFECTLYDGIAECIRELKKMGYVIALASSKLEAACVRILEHFKMAEYFDFIVGSDLDGNIRSKQEVLEELGRRMEQRNIKKEDMCLIGDTKYDVEGAGQFGIACIGVTYGFGTEAELKDAGAARICNSASEVLACFLTD